jgi:membrane fusion protein (multidrug efflux system)
MTKVSILVVALALAGCNEQGKAPAAGPGGAPPPPADVGFVTLEPRTVAITTDVAGRVLPSLIAEVRPQVSGIIEKRLFVEGAEVKEGDVLYQIADASYRAAQASSQAALDRAKAALVAAQAKADRYKTLANRDIASQQDTETAVAAAQQATADVAAAKAALEAASINLGYTKVRAPISGRIGVSALTEGALVTANQATALAVIQALDPVFVDTPQSATAILSTRADLESGRIKQGPKGVEMSLTLDNGVVYNRSGQLKFTDVTVSQSTGTVTLRATFPNPDRILLPGMFVRGVATLGQREGAILAPQRAVTRDPRGAATAFVVTAQDKIEPRQLTVSRSVGSDWLVEKGLAPGDRLVMDGFQRIRPGASVKPVPFQPAPAPGTAPSAPAGPAPDKKN